ncbi:unnamed protein product [Phytomonas sp. EM1]|nr:unnamed protein product [Phytomonas sp. EM1]|eukprot:CCW64448.1 unnamed protein product [Phytomonas sp. isolate EM1]
MLRLIFPNSVSYFIFELSRCFYELKKLKGLFVRLLLHRLVFLENKIQKRAFINI